MDIIILGLLMLQNCTMYEMRKLIDTNFSNISSSSTGSMQAALKKLADKGMISFTEHVENSVNKKVYSITQDGRSYFMDSITTPMLHKEKNMELSKFFFMGFADADKWDGLIDAYIAELNKELNRLERLNAALPPRNEIDRDYIDSLRREGLADEITDELAVNIAAFQYATLDLSMAQLKFQINWFGNFKDDLLHRNKSKADWREA